MILLKTEKFSSFAVHKSSTFFDKKE